MNSTYMVVYKHRLEVAQTARQMAKLLSMLIVSIAIFVNLQVAYALEEEVSKYLAYIDSSILSMSLSEAAQILKDNEEVSESVDVDGTQNSEQKFEQTKNKAITEGLAHFRNALLSGTENDITNAIAYWQALYAKDDYKNPLTLAYYATLESMLGGAVNGVIKKVRYTKSGIAMLARAAQEISVTNDDLAKGYVYFLQGNTHANLPVFFKEFKKETINTLKKAERHYKKSKRSKLYSEGLINALEANLYTGFATWYEKSSQYSSAIKYYKAALEKIKEQSGTTATIIAKKLAALQEKKD